MLIDLSKLKRWYKKKLSKQILKYIGNKHRYANEIISYFPKKFKSYYEPFLGSAAILYHLNPKKLSQN